MWTSVNTGMFSYESLGGDEENNSVDSKEPEGRERENSSRVNNEAAEIYSTCLKS